MENGPAVCPSVSWVELSDRRTAEHKPTSRALISVPRVWAPQLHNRHAEDHRSFACPHVCDFHLSSPQPSVVFPASRVFLLSRVRQMSQHPLSTQRRGWNTSAILLHDNILFFNIFFFPLSGCTPQPWGLNHTCKFSLCL